MNQKVITVILVLIIVGGLAWYFNRNYLQPSNKPGETQSFASSSPGKSTGQTSGNLVYVIFGNTQEIWMANSLGQKKKLFTDADETEKIIKLSNLAPLSREVLAITSADKGASSGKLEVINLDNAKKEILQPSFVASFSINVSADGKDIAYIKFSNVEENYGYTLYSQKRTGFNLRELVRSSSEIRLPAWNKDSTKIAFVKIDGTKSELEVVSREGGEASSIVSFSDKIVDWLSWDKSDNIILSLRKIGESGKSEIISVSSQGKNLQKITETDGGMANFVYLSKDSWLGYLIGQYQDKISENLAGQIYFQNLQTKEKIPLQKGNQVLGWLP